MSDELQQVENAGQEVIGVYADTIRFIHSFMNEMSEFKSSLPQRQPKPKDDTLSQMSSLTSFKFTGQDTDMCYFEQSDKMPLTAIANISDESVKKSVLESFNRFVEKDYLTIKDGYLHITPKGKKYIQNDFFIKQAKADQKQVHNDLVVKSAERENTTVIALTGDYKDDFTYFYYSDKLDLNEVISNPNKKLSEQILDNVEVWQKKGAVTVNDNGIATVTPNGKAMLNMPEFQKRVNYLHPKELSEVNVKSSQFIVKIQTAVKTPVQQAVMKNTVTKAIKR